MTRTDLNYALIKRTIVAWGLRCRGFDITELALRKGMMSKSKKVYSATKTREGR